jgi:molybdopterin adenylyltransferase
VIQGSVVHVCVSAVKGSTKQPTSNVRMVADHGIEGDAHAGTGHRQISLLDIAEIDAFRQPDVTLAAGAFGENIATKDIDLSRLGIGARLRLGEAELEITQVGKVCHDRCAIYERMGDCIMPRAGVFARALRGGHVAVGSPVVVTQEVPRTTIQAAVLTVSDRCAASETEDVTGPRISVEVREQLGAHVAWTGIVPDEADRIVESLRAMCERGLDLVLTCGGTGFGPRDVTPEATATVIERDAPGLAEAMRSASMRITPHAMLQRGRCGICGNTLILNLPGSPKGASENLMAVVAALPHAVQLLRGHTAHPPASSP